MIKKSLMVFFSIIFSFTLFELLITEPELTFDPAERRLGLQDYDCYSTKPAGNNIYDLNSIETLNPHGKNYISPQIQKYKDITKDSSFCKFYQNIEQVSYSQYELIKKRFPYCIFKNQFKRLDGFYTQRKDEVFLVGDSFTFGQGVADNETLGFFLGYYDQSSNYRNFGCSGGNIADVLDVVERVESTFEVSKVFYIYNLNDVYLSDQLSVLEKKIIFDLQNVYWERSKFISFLNRILFLKSAKLLLNAVVKKSITQETIDYYNRAYFDYQHNVNDTFGSIIELNSKSSFTLTVVIYPLLYKDILGRYPFDRIHKKIMSFCMDHNIRCIDGRNAFAEDYSMRKYWVHKSDHHPNSRANSKMAKFIFEKSSKDNDSEI